MYISKQSLKATVTTPDTPTAGPHSSQTEALPYSTFNFQYTAAVQLSHVIFRDVLCIRTNSPVEYNHHVLYTHTNKKLHITFRRTRANLQKYNCIFLNRTHKHMPKCTVQAGIGRLNFYTLFFVLRILLQVHILSVRPIQNMEVLFTLQRSILIVL